METRHQSKRRWQSSPGKKARMELDFGQNTPSPKRIKLGRPVIPLTRNSEDDDVDSFTVKSFYGKREKINFPHSPGRRKAVAKVLDKISDENTDSENERREKKRQASGKHSNNNKMSSFDFHSSDSADTENEGQGRSVLSQKNIEHNSSKKVPLKIVKLKRTPKNSFDKKVCASSTGKIPNKVDQKKEQEMTPLTKGKKFFKSRSPASADKCFGNLVIKKGFELKFYPKRLNLTKKSNLAKSESKGSSKKTKTKLVETVKALKAKPFDRNAVFFVDDSLKPDGTDLSDSQLEITSDTNKKVVPVNEISNGNEFFNEKTDSGIETANSNDLFSSPTDSNTEDVTFHKTLEEDGQNTLDTETEQENNSEDMSETVSLLGAGSEDLFSNSGRSTPQNAPSGEVTPLEQTPVQSKHRSPSGSSEGSEDGTKKSKQLKFFPIFMKKSPSSSSQLGKLRSKGSPSGSKSPGGSTKNSPLLKYVKSKDNMEQMIIDAGQKRFGATTCEVCGMVYTMSEPADETTHYKFHQSLLNVLKFPGWKREHVVQEYMDTGSRVIMITPESPKYAIRKLEEISKIIGQELGYQEPGLTARKSYKTFLYVSEDKKIEGCCVTEPVNKGYRLLPDTQVSESLQSHPGHRPSFCSDKPEAVQVGVSRIWVHSQARRKGVATRLLDCVRQWSVYGTVVSKQKLAFSDPTHEGRALASRYFGTECFLVFKYH